MMKPEHMTAQEIEDLVHELAESLAVTLATESVELTTRELQLPIATTQRVCLLIAGDAVARIVARKVGP